MTAEVWAVCLNSCCSRSAGLWRLSSGEALGEMPPAATPAGPLLKDSCENWLQSSVTDRIRAISDFFFVCLFEVAVYSGLEC